jgi:hypothetical protein
MNQKEDVSQIEHHEKDACQQELDSHCGTFRAPKTAAHCAGE